jgi:hypothetical protein
VDVDPQSAPKDRQEGIDHPIDRVEDCADDREENELDLEFIQWRSLVTQAPANRV